MGEEDGTESGEQIGKLKTIWRNRKCAEAGLYWAGAEEKQRRAISILCRGPKFTIHQARMLTGLEKSLGSIYRNSRVCKTPARCYRIEPDLDKIMQESRDPKELLWAWKGWRDTVGPPSRELYPALIMMENQAAMNNGYNNMGECWREELEIPDLEQFVEQLYAEISPLHRLLHAFVRHKLSQMYGRELVDPNTTMPAHLLGNMWAQSWESLHPELAETIVDLDGAVVNRSTNELFEIAQEFYTSIGFRNMPKNFWKNSKTVRSENGSCHGTAANMYTKDDYRMLLCWKGQWEDFYVMHHEMGHIQYYMAYEKQPTIFKDGANSAFQEAIGDTIMLAVETRRHLQQIGIIKKNPILLEDLELSLLLRQALKKIPQITFGLVVDKWRWGVMSSKILPKDYNAAWWQYRRKYEGLHPPVLRAETDFDPAAKFHVADNTPYIRYFLSEFLQFQFLDILCDVSNTNQKYLLHQCDLYGSKDVGKRMK
ncbi:hypothetical protein AAG570_010074 [Ranatra chinensis]|uniref:Angiotensin-converting enzyme n=1 Tax=Ranatra chinensis TaxID=642074 RepID=A0ABD0YLH0_9HEMI